MRFLFKPGWVAFVLVVIAFAVACYTLLAPWQFRRNAEQAAQNQEITASFAHPPQPLGELVPPGSAPVESVRWRQAVLRGEYLPADEAVVRLRTVLASPAFEVLTAFRTDDGRVVAIDRGYVRPGEGRQVAIFPPAPTGSVTLTGRIQLDESDPQHRASFTSGGHQQLYAVSSQLLGQEVGQPVAPGYLQLVDDQPGGLGVLPLPDTDSGPFLSYAWQWLTFGAMALFGLGYFVRLEILQRRAPEDGDEELAGAQVADPGHRPRPGGVVRGAFASVRAERASIRQALRDGDRPDTPADWPEPPAHTAPERPESPAPARDHLVDRYGKARF